MSPRPAREKVSLCIVAICCYERTAVQFAVFCPLCKDLGFATPHVQKIPH